MTPSTPLLGAEDGEQYDPQPISPPFLHARRPKTTCILLSFVIFAAAFSGSLAEVPTTRLIEDNLCQRYYFLKQHGTGSPTKGIEIDESLCKIDEIQSQLAYLNGWVPMIEAIIGMIVALPYSSYADKRGRKPVLWLSLIGISVAAAWVALVLAIGPRISIRFILLSPIVTLCGGGSTVLVSVLYAMVADVVSEADRVSGFLTLSLGIQVGGLFGPLAASSLMDSSSPWTPLALSFVLLAVTMGFAVFIPETLTIRIEDRDWNSYRNDSTRSIIISYFREFRGQIEDAVNMASEPSLSLIFFAFLCVIPVGMATGSLFVQYVSKRFDWTMAAAGYLLSIRGIGNILTVLVIIPGLSRLLTSGVVFEEFSPGEKDRLLAQASAFALSIGFVLIACTNMSIVVVGLMVKTLGAGLPSLCRSLAAYHASPQHSAKLQTVIGITETLGLLVASPGLALLFSLGMYMGGPWMGLPYMVMSAFLAITAAALCFVARPTTLKSPVPFGEAFEMQDPITDGSSMRNIASVITPARDKRS